MTTRVEKTDSFLCNCKLLYFLSAIPGEADGLEEYRRLELIAKSYFAASQLQYVSQYLHLQKYEANLWAAYLILKYGSPDSKLEFECREILKRTSFKIPR